MKKWLVLFGTLLLCVVMLAGCGVGSVGEDHVRIGLSLATRDRFLTSMESAAARAASEAEIRLDVANANNDDSVQMAQIEEWADAGYAAALVVLCKEESAKKILEKAGSMPVVFVNRRPSDDVLRSRTNAVYIGGREQDAGRMQGQFLADRFNEAGLKFPNIAVITANAGSIASQERMQAAMQTLQKDGISPSYIYQKDAGWDRETAQKGFFSFVKTKPKVDAVLAANDEMAIGAAAALVQAGYATSEVLVVGVDATAEGKTAIRDGRMNFTAYQNPEEQGAGAVELAVSMLGGKKPEGLDQSIRWLDYTAVTADNIDELFPKD